MLIRFPIPCRSWRDLKGKHKIWHVPSSNGAARQSNLACNANLGHGESRLSWLMAEGERVFKQLLGEGVALR
jgi:hypothetical protein